jgi:hypothetical protein
VGHRHRADILTREYHRTVSRHTAPDPIEFRAENNEYFIAKQIFVKRLIGEWNAVRRDEEIGVFKERSVRIHQMKLHRPLAQFRLAPDRSVVSWRAPVSAHVADTGTRASGMVFVRSGFQFHRDRQPLLPEEIECLVQIARFVVVAKVLYYARL